MESSEHIISRLTGILDEVAAIANKLSAPAEITISEVQKLLDEIGWNDYIYEDIEAVQQAISEIRGGSRDDA